MANQDERNIVLVLHEGDLVKQNAIAEGSGRGFANQLSFEITLRR